jgi:hypothetical protein
MSVKSTASFAAILIAGGTVGSVITTALRAQSTPPAYLIMTWRRSRRSTDPRSLRRCNHLAVGLSSVVASWTHLRVRHPHAL